MWIYDNKCKCNILQKDGLSYIKLEQPDVLCVQEIKCEKSKIPAAVKLDGYSNHWYPAETPGYSGVGMYFKDKPVSITEGIGENLCLLDIMYGYEYEIANNY